MALNLDQMELSKVFVELRHREVFSLPDNKYKILDKLTPKYPGYNIEQPDLISLINPEKQIQIHSHLNRLIFDWDAPVSLKEFYTESAEVVDTITSVLKIDVVVRTGLRIHWKQRFNNQIDIVRYIMDNFVTHNVRNTSQLCDEIFEPNIKFSGRKGTLKFNLNVGVIQEQIIQGTLNNPVTHITNHYLLVDLDIYRDVNQKPKNISHFYRDAEEFINNHFKKYILNI
jgi:hypothetical protein